MATPSPPPAPKAAAAFAFAVAPLAITAGKGLAERMTRYAPRNALFYEGDVFHVLRSTGPQSLAGGPGELLALESTQRLSSMWRSYSLAKYLRAQDRVGGRLARAHMVVSLSVSPRDPQLIQCSGVPLTWIYPRGARAAAACLCAVKHFPHEIVFQEGHDIPGHMIRHVGRHDDHAPEHDGAGGMRLSWVMGQSNLRCRDAAAGRSTGLYGLDLPLPRNTAADVTHTDSRSCPWAPRRGRCS